MGEKGARVSVRVGFVSVLLRAARRAVPGERPGLQGDVRPGGVCELLQSLHLQVEFSFLGLFLQLGALFSHQTATF